MESVLREKWHSYERGAREFSRSCQGQHLGGEPLKADGATPGMKGAKWELGLLSVGAVALKSQPFGFQTIDPWDVPVKGGGHRHMDWQDKVALAHG